MSVAAAVMMCVLDYANRCLFKQAITQAELADDILSAFDFQQAVQAAGSNGLQQHHEQSTCGI